MEAKHIKPIFRVPPKFLISWYTVPETQMGTQQVYADNLTQCKGPACPSHDRVMLVRGSALGRAGGGLVKGVPLYDDHDHYTCMTPQGRPGLQPYLA